MQQAYETQDLEIAALYLKYTQEPHVLHARGLRIVAGGMHQKIRKVSVSKLGDTDIELMVINICSFTPAFEIIRDLTRVIEEM